MATRQLVVEIVGDADSLTRTFTKASSATHKFGRDISETDRSLTKVTRGAIAGSGAFRGLGQSIAFASGSFLGAAGFAAIVRQSIGLASDLNEQLNKVRVVFRSGAADVIAFSKTSTNALAITQDEALATAGVFGNMLVPMGFARKEAAGMSIQLVKLAADMASFNNADPSDVLDALRSGLAGEVEPLRRFGVQLSDARERAVLTAAGVKNLGGTLTAQQRSWAAYQLILHDTADAQGDFARTSHGLANQQRILRAQLQQMEAQIGQGLLPAVLHITRGLTDWLGKTENQRLVQRKANEAIHTAGEVFRGLGHALKIVGGIIHQVDRVTGSLTNTMEILIGLKLASMFRGWSRNMAIFGATTQTAGIRAKGLLATMRTLSATPFIITIAFVFTENDMKERAKAFVQKWIKEHNDEALFPGIAGPVHGGRRGGGTPRGSSIPSLPGSLPGSTSAAGGVDAFTLPFRLRLAQAKAEITKTMADDIAALRAIAAYIRNRIPHLHGEKLIEAYQELASVNQELAADLSNAAKKAKQARQEQVRALNTRVITEGLGLTKEQRDELRARLSSIDARGRSLHHAGVGAYGYEIDRRSGRPIHHHHHVHVNGREMATVVTNEQQRRRRRNSSQRRGPNAGD